MVILKSWSRIFPNNGGVGMGLQTDQSQGLDRPQILRPKVRASSYIIYVDLKDEPDSLLLVHGYSGAYDKISRRAASFIRGLDVTPRHKPLYGEWADSPPFADVGESVAEELLEHLVRRGYLTSLTVEDELSHFKELANSLHKSGARPEYIFMPTYDCNLRCPYCFQDHMRTNENNKHLLRRMSEETVDRIFRAIPDIEEKCGVTPSESFVRDFGFFGGEPFLKANYPIVKRIIESARNLGKASFWAISNATELHEYTDLLGPDLIARLQITLDGPRSLHDTRRVYPDGRGSFEIIASNITMALDRGVAVGIRVNFDRANLPSAPELARTIVDYGWNKYPNFAAYAAPIVASNGKTLAKSTFGSLELFRALTEMRATYPEVGILSRPDDRLVIMAHQVFQSGIQPMFQATFCGAQNGLFIFDSFGDAYACLERTGDRRLRIGHVNEDGAIAINEQIYNMWRTRNVTSNETCSRCRYALSCGGGCAILAEARGAGFNQNHCDGYQARFRSCISDAYTDFRAGKSASVKVSRACHA
jgi:uncharacterized protein